MLLHLALLSLAMPGSPQAPDRDGDGLSDFEEIHKYGTDPDQPDSDGDGTDDSDWLERREYAYTVRAVVQVMKPVTLAYLNDDFQDVRLLDQTDQHVELEVIVYPLSTANSAIAASPDWHQPHPDIARWLEPGPTSDWTPQLRAELLQALRADGIDLDAMNDREAAERVSDWLMRRAQSHNGFSSFITSFDEEGEPYIPDALRNIAAQRQERSGRTLADQWQQEISAAGMYANSARGSCTSSAIYLSGCLRAAGLPTRTVLCIPLIDANDAQERRMAARNLSHHRVRRMVTAAAHNGIGSWTSHTFNEVWVGHRWRRLNYSKLGQDVLDPDYLGVMIHIATFHDWADARMPETVGKRQELNEFDDTFGGPNPYSTISLRDEFGEHCSLENPPPAEERFRVETLHWTDDPALPADITENCQRKNRFGLIALIHPDGSNSGLPSFLASADLNVTLAAAGHPTLQTSFHPRCYWNKTGGVYIYLPFDERDRQGLAQGVPYAVRATNGAPGYAWILEDEITRGASGG